MSDAKALRCNDLERSIKSVVHNLYGPLLLDTCEYCCVYILRIQAALDAWGLPSAATCPGVHLVGRYAGARLARFTFQSCYLVSVSVADSFQCDSHLICISLSNNSIATMYGGTFSGLEGLESLCLPHSNIAVIDGGAFDGLTSLTTLDLASNDIFNNPPAALPPSLQTLDLSLNNIPELSKQALAGLDQLKRLNLSKNDFDDTSTWGGQVFVDLGKLQTLDLSSNTIAIIPSGTFTYLTQLQTLDLSSNTI